MLSRSAGAHCSQRLLLDNADVNRMSMRDGGRRQGPQGTWGHAWRVHAPWQQIRQPRACPGRCFAASSSAAASDSRRLMTEALLWQVEEQQGAGKRPKEVPDYDAAQLLLSLGLPTGGSDKLQKAVAKLYVVRQHGVVQHSSQVAAHLRSLAVEEKQLAQLVAHCPELFSWPAEERAAVLFGQLQQLGLSATQAGNCFEKQPTAASVPSFQPAIDVLAALYEAAGGKGGESGHRRLGGLLRRQPSGGSLLIFGSDTLQERIANLRRLGLSSAQIVAGLRQSWRLLTMAPTHLAKREQLLQQELGIGGDLFAKLLCRRPESLSRSEVTLRQRARALAGVFGGEAVPGMVHGSPGLLTIGSPGWQAALEVMRLVGVTDPVAVAQRNAQVLAINWLEPRKLANRLVLERCLGLTPADVYQQYATYTANTGSDRLVGRLLYLEQCGLLPLVEDKRARLRAWRREQEVDARCTAPGEPALISLCDVCTLQDPAFLGLLSKNGCSSGFAAFQAGLESMPAYLDLWAAAEAEAALLRAALPDELREQMAAAADEEAAEEGDE